MAQEVRAKVLELYQHQDPAVKQAADAALQAFQETDMAWAVSQELLADADPNVQFFGASTLYRKVQRTAQGYEEAGKVDLQALVPIIQRWLESPGTTNPSKQRLVLALSAIAVALCTTTWQSAVPDLLRLATAQPLSKLAWCALLSIPEQLSAVVHTYVKTDKRTEALLGASDALLGAALSTAAITVSHAADEASTGTIADSEFSLVMQTLAQWSKVMGLQLASHAGFAAHLVALLDSPAASSEVVTEVVLEVLRSSTGSFLIYNSGQKAAPALEGLLAAVTRKMQALLPRIQQAGSGPALSLEEQEGQQLARWARVAGTLIEAYTQLLWLDEGAAEVLVSFIAACFVVHPHVANSVFELWAVLKDSNRDGKLPAGVLPRLLQRLAAPCLASFARFGRFDSPYADERSELEQLRSAQQDILVDMYCIADKTPEAQLILSLMHGHLERAEAAQDMIGVEVAWFAFAGIAEVLADEPSIPEVFAAVLQSVFRTAAGTQEQLSTAAALLRACGPHFEKSLQPHLAQAVQWLVGMVSRIPTEASEAVQELCGYAGQFLLPHVGEFLKVVVQVAPNVPAEVDASLHGALVGITRSLPPDQAVPAFQQICEGTATALAAGLDMTTESGRMMLHRCLGRVLRCALVAEEGGSQQGAPGQPSPAAQCAATCLARFLLAQWPVLGPPCQQLLTAAPVAKEALKGKPMYEYSDVAVQVNIIAMLRRAAKASTETLDGGQELGLRVMELAVGCCKVGQLAPLSPASLVAGRPETARACVLPALGEVCAAALQQLQAGGSAEAAIPVLDLASGLAASVGDELFQSQHMAMLTQLCVFAMGSSQQEVLKPALLFLQKLLMSRVAGLGEHDVWSIVQAVLVHFHSWPRSIGGQSFKVFCAIAERYEAALVQLVAAPAAIPSLAGLPPGEQLLAQRAFQKLRGPRLRAFLGDLASVARSENTIDVLQAYAVE